MRNLLMMLMIMAALLCSCDEVPSHADVESMLVVEGWIETDGFPVVIVTRSMPVNDDYRDPDELNDYLVRWARVAVTDGTDTVVLTGKYDDGYFPPYIYTTTRMRGRSGGYYTVLVEYGDMRASATTTIPAGVPPCSFRVEPSNDADTLFQVIARFEDFPQEKNYYQFFTRVGSDNKQYLASYLGSVDDAVLGAFTELPIYRGHHFTAQEYTPYYRMGDTLSVKFAQVDEASYRFWDNYTKNLSLSGNMFLSSDTHLFSNMNGGTGFWYGMAAVTDFIVIGDSVKSQGLTGTNR